VRSEGRCPTSVPPAGTNLSPSAPTKVTINKTRRTIQLENPDGSKSNIAPYDANTGLATYRTPDGLVRRSVVPPNLRAFAADRGPGARVLVTMTKAVAVSVTPAT